MAGSADGGDFQLARLGVGGLGQGHGNEDGGKKSSSLMEILRGRGNMA
jgi:hypothetical protein